MRIISTGSYLPIKNVTNDDLAQIVDTNDEWISSRTGIKSRHIIDDDTCCSLGTKAALNALSSCELDAADIDLIILATMTPDSLLPNGACQIQKNIGAVNATCFDLNAACSGFLFALNTANAYLSSGMYKNALVIGAEALSKIIDWNDRATCVLFGDGAGAAIVTADDTKAYVSITGSDGEKGDVLTGGSLPVKNFLLPETEAAINYYMQMDGQEVFKFAVTKVPECIKQVLDKACKSIDEINYFVLHQANIRIISSVAKRLNIDIDKLPTNLHNYGNTSAASIPILLDEMNKQGQLHEGDKLVLSGFGGGLTWGASYIEL